MTFQLEKCIYSVKLLFIKQEFEILSFSCNNVCNIIFLANRWTISIRNNKHFTRIIALTAKQTNKSTPRFAENIIIVANTRYAFELCRLNLARHIARIACPTARSPAIKNANVRGELRLMGQSEKTCSLAHYI